MHRGHSESALLPKTLAFTFFKSTSVQSGPFLSWGDQQTQKLPYIESKISLSFLLLSLFFLLFLMCHLSPYSPLGLSSIFLTKFDSDIILFHDYKNFSYVRCMKIFIEYQNCSQIFTRFDIVWKSVVCKTGRWEILRRHKLWQPFTLLCSQLTYLQHLLRSNIVHIVKIAFHFLMAFFWLVILYFCRANLEVYGL